MSRELAVGKLLVNMKERYRSKFQNIGVSNSCLHAEMTTSVTNVRYQQASFFSTTSNAQRVVTTDMYRFHARIPRIGEQSSPDRMIVADPLIRSYFDSSPYFHTAPIQLFMYTKIRHQLFLKLAACRAPDEVRERRGSAPEFDFGSA
jgi:hypothetical protein